MVISICWSGQHVRIAKMPKTAKPAKASHGHDCKNIKKTPTRKNATITKLLILPTCQNYKNASFANVSTIAKECQNVEGATFLERQN